MVRAAHLTRLRGGAFDVLVIGGGITGAGVACEAAARGLSVALIERGDFAQGTSSGSTKLIHGGLRYLPMLDIAQVREGLEEQNRLLRNAPYLVRPLPFVLPLYRGSVRPLGLSFPRPLRAGLPLGLAFGLWAYDRLGGRDRLRGHRRLAPADASALVPALRRDGMRCAFLYYDAQTDDARLTLTVLRTAVSHGAVVVNYAEAVGVRAEAGRCAGADVVDRRSGARFVVSARTTINAAGVWAEAVAGLAAPPTFRIRRAKGVHLVLSNARLGMHRAALVLPETDDGRIAFVVPWQGALLLGTTDTEWRRADDEPDVARDDVAYLLGHASRFLTVPLHAREILGAFASLRPLVSLGARPSARLSRRHEVVRSAEGFYSIIGGKLTTYRRMAEDVMNAATGRRAGTPSPTRTLPLVGAAGLRQALPALRDRARRLRLPRRTVLHLIRTYGTEAARVCDLVAERPALGTPLVEACPHIGAEVVVAARHEMAGTLEDVLLRRTRLAHLLPRQGAEIASQVAALMGDELGWPPDEQADRVAEYARAVRRLAAPGAAIPPQAVRPAGGAPGAERGGGGMR
ncbi:MAG TPA: glycerol-3-phosphate dehydrogenase/oxidase [bacterium]|nr:glycerol-3-phosphate dehydrogenase/oxidase [bacterium]